MTFRRYVAIGDSTTEGLDDPYPDGTGYRGWADRLAGRLAELEPDLAYANLAIRGRLAAQVHAEQLEPALAWRPDLVTVVAGLNDALRRGFDLDATAGHLETMLARLRETGATVLTFTFPTRRR
jgi:lysophospholipase L1-like esterase